MFVHLPRAWWLIAGITGLSVLVTQLGGKAMLETTKANRGGLAAGYLIGGAVFGLVAIQVYLWMGQRWPDTVASVYFWTAIALTAVLTIAAIGMYWVVKDVRVVTVWVVLNLLWGLGYGWFIPRLLAI